jgi:Mn2+/Fe2+ NRAMP family transporter
LEKTFVALVLVMSMSFTLTAILTGPNILEVLIGLFVPKVPKDGILTIIALVGTTVVPYNLFLHASLVSEKWKNTDGLPAAKKDTLVAVVLGGFVSICIIVSASAITSSEVSSVMDMAEALEPLYGASARYFMGIGLFAAGITSAITAPLAAAYVVNSCFGWKAGLKDNRFRAVWIGILAAGVFFLSFNIKPIEVIKFSQIANGILLPVIAILLLWVVNRKAVMGVHRNTKIQNIAGVVIIVLALILGVKSIISVLGLW